MDSSNPSGQDKSRWRFDPNTGEPIGDSSSAQPPTEPAEPTEPAPQEAFRAPQQPTQPEYPQQYPAAPPTPPYGYEVQPPAEPPVQPPTQPAPQYGYPAYQQPTQPMPPYGYQAQQAPVMAEPPAAVVVEKRRSRVPLVIGAVLVLVVALGIGGFFLAQNLLNPPAVSAERLLPANTLGYFTFDPVLEGSQKAAMDKIGEAFTSQPGFKDAMANITKNFTEMLGESPGSQATPSAGDFDAITSYLGNSVTLALLPPSSDDLNKLKDATNSGDMDTVGPDVLGRNVVGILDLDFNPLDKKGPIPELKQQAENIAKSPLVEKYRDVEIHKYVTNTTEIYFALLGGSSTAIVGAQTAPLHVVIDQYKDNKSLKDDATFKALAGQVPNERIAALYLNLTEVYQQVSLIAPDALGTNGVQSANGAMLLTLSAANDGLQLDVASEADLSVMNTGVQVNPNAKPDPSTLNDIPANSLGFIAGTDLKTALQGALDTIRKNQNTGNDIEQSLKDFQQQYGVDVEKDILPLLDGDYSLSVSATANQGSDPTFSVVFQIKVKDGAQAQAVLDKIVTSDAAKDNTEKVSAAGGTFYTSKDGTEGVLIGVTQNRLMVVVNSVGLDGAKANLEDTVSNFGKGLGSSANWNANKTHLPDGSNIIGYFDLKATRELAETTIPDSDKQEYDSSVKPFLAPFKYLLLGSATQATKDGNLSRNHTVLFIGISK